MRLTSDLTDEAILRTLGERIERQRIEAGITQAELAREAGISKRTLERIEGGNGCELVMLIRVLRTLKLAEGFNALVPELPPSPMAQLKLRGKQRRRVVHPRGARPPSPAPTPASLPHSPSPAKRPQASTPSSTPRKPWTWGEK